jgi:hypothetical protein
MKKKSIIICVVLIGFVLALTANSWAQRENVGKRHQNRGGNFQKWDKPAVHKFDRYRGRVSLPAKHRNRPVHYFKPHLKRRHQIYKLHRYWRPSLPRWRNWRHHRPAVIHKHYGSAESYVAPEEAFQASAAVSDSGFSVSVGVSRTN